MAPSWMPNSPTLAPAPEAVRDTARRCAGRGSPCALRRTACRWCARRRSRPRRSARGPSRARACRPRTRPIARRTAPGPQETNGSRSIAEHVRRCPAELVRSVERLDRARLGRGRVDVVGLAAAVAGSVPLRNSAAVSEPSRTALAVTAFFFSCAGPTLLRGTRDGVGAAAQRDEHRERRHHVGVGESAAAAGATHAHWRIEHPAGSSLAPPE